MFTLDWMGRLFAKEDGGTGKLDKRPCGRASVFWSGCRVVAFERVEMRWEGAMTGAGAGRRDLRVRKRCIFAIVAVILVRLLVY